MIDGALGLAALATIAASQTSHLATGTPTHADAAAEQAAPDAVYFDVGLPVNDRENSPVAIVSSLHPGRGG